MAFKFGRELRNSYAALFGPDYSQAKIHFRSTDTSRTIGSAQYISAGIFAPSSVQTWKDAAQYIAPSIEVVPWDQDYELAQRSTCRKTDQLRSAYLNSAAVKAKFNEYSAFWKYLERNSGSPARQPDDIFMFYDSLHIERMRGLT